MDQYRKKVLLGGLLIAAVALIINAVITKRANWYLSYEIRHRRKAAHEVLRAKAEDFIRLQRTKAQALAEAVQGQEPGLVGEVLAGHGFRDSFTHLSLLNGAGIVVYSTDLGLEPGADLSGSGAYQASTRSTFVTDRDLHGEVHLSFFVSSPVGQDGLLVGEVPVARIGEQLGDGDFYLLGPHPEYRLLYCPQPVRASRIDMEQIRAQTDLPEVGYYENFRGQRVLGVNATLTEMGWTLLSETPQEEAREGVEQLFLANRYLILLVCFGVVGIGYYFQRNIHQPILELNQAVNRISEGDLSARVTIQTGDELEELGNRFNAMAGRLEELVGELEDRVGARTLELDRANAELKVMNRLKSEFLANMSHELRTPLNSIIGFSELMHDGIVGDLNEDQQQCVSDILESGKHLLGLINNILDLSKIEAGKMELHPEEFNLAELVDGLVRAMTSLTDQKHQTLTAEVDPDLGPVVADKGKVKQVILNLLSNAHKFTPEEGTITLRARAGEAGFEVVVEDTGVGIAPEDQEAVFEEFRQVDGSHTREQEGTGLGLSLTRKLVELHGGRMWLESQPGEGSAFYFSVPEENYAEDAYRRG